MRRQLLSLLVVGMLGLVLPSASGATSPEGEAASPARATEESPVGGVRDEAAMIIVGAVLIGVAAAVRRTA